MNDYTIGTVYLNVKHLDNMIAFYEEVIGLGVHDRSGKTVSLGAGEQDMLVLTETPDKQHHRSRTGLYHFAILVPSRLQLAKSLARIAQTETPLQGLSDHIVSEAIYLADPEGNGIEIYRDRPRDDWYKDGEFQLATLPMDVNGLRNTLKDDNTGWEGLPSGTIMGHIHLHVADIPETETFYRDILGMDVMANVGSATFMSYEGYHHHLGGNIWGGRTKRTGQEAGLDKYDLHIHDAGQLDAILENAEAHGVEITEDNGLYSLYDPSNNHVVLRHP